MAVMPSSGGAPSPRSQPPGGQDSGGSAAQQAVSMIQNGYQQLGELMKSAGGNLDPQDLKLFQNAVQATDTFFQALMGPVQEAQPQAPKSGPTGPMPLHASANGKPAPQY